MMLEEVFPCALGCCDLQILGRIIDAGLQLLNGFIVQARAGVQHGQRGSQCEQHAQHCGSKDGVMCLHLIAEVEWNAVELCG